MPVNINECGYGVWLLSVVENGLDKLLDLVHSGVQSRVRRDKLPVQIVTRQRSPVIAGNNPVWVGHRNHLENDPLPQLLGFRAHSNDEFEKAFNDVACI